MIEAERLLATAIRQGDKMADQIADEMERANRHWKAVWVAALMMDHGDAASARKVLQAAMNWEEGRRGGRRPAAGASDQDSERGMEGGA